MSQLLRFDAFVRSIPQRPLTERDAAELKAFMEKWASGDPQRLAYIREREAQIDRDTRASKVWEFWMSDLGQVGDVLTLMRTRSKRLRLSMALWSLITRKPHLDRVCGLVRLRRLDMVELLRAEGIKASEQHVSEVLSEFVSWNVLIAFDVGRERRWRLNPNIATTIPGKAGEEDRERAGKVVFFPDPRQLELV